MAVNHGLYLGMDANPSQGIEDESSTAKYALGSFFDDENGRRFRYALNGAGALVAGDLVSSAAAGGSATTLQTVGIIGQATASGLVNIPVASLTTSQVADLYAEGWAAFEDTSATGTYLRRIKSNTALVHTTWADTPMEIVLYEELPVALTTSDTVALMVNPYSKIIQGAAATLTGYGLGGVCAPITAAYYCWVQTRGWFGCHILDGALVAGMDVEIGATTAGTPTSKTELLFGQNFGYAGLAWADDSAGILYLQCE
jgi:hypothetical protein